MKYGHKWFTFSRPILSPSTYITQKPFRGFCTTNFPVKNEVLERLRSNSEISEQEKEEIETLYQNIDMDELRNYNPKLFEYLYFDPTKIKDFKTVVVDGNVEKAQIIADRKSQSELADAAEAAAAGAASQNAAKVYTLPLFWKWLTPVFAVTSVWILKLQAATHIPWLPFLVL